MHCIHKVLPPPPRPSVPAVLLFHLVTSISIAVLALSFSFSSSSNFYRWFLVSRAQAPSNIGWRNPIANIIVLAIVVVVVGVVGIGVCPHFFRAPIPPGPERASPLPPVRAFVKDVRADPPVHLSVETLASLARVELTASGRKRKQASVFVFV